MEYSLYLYPEVEQALVRPINIEALSNFLQQNRFIAAIGRDNHWSPGAKIMDFITFVGCSPALQRGEIESLIRFHQRDHVFALGGTSIVALRYPGCKHLIQHGAELLARYPEHSNWQCPECGQQGEITAINWRQSAGFSNLFVEVTRIFPKEAVPSDKLLACLREQSGFQWQWFYSLSQAD